MCGISEEKSESELQKRTGLKEIFGEKKVRCIVPSKMDDSEFLHCTEQKIPSHTIIMKSEDRDELGKYIFNIDEAFNKILLNEDEKVTLDVKLYVNCYGAEKNPRCVIFMIQIFNDDDEINNELRKLCEDFPSIIKEFLYYRFMDVYRSIYNDSCNGTITSINKSWDLLVDEYAKFCLGRKFIILAYGRIANDYMKIDRAKNHHFLRNLRNPEFVDLNIAPSQYELTLKPKGCKYPKPYPLQSRGH